MHIFLPYEIKWQITYWIVSILTIMGRKPRVSPPPFLNLQKMVPREISKQAQENEDDDPNRLFRVPIQGKEEAILTKFSVVVGAYRRFSSNQQHAEKKR